MSILTRPRSAFEFHARLNSRSHHPDAQKISPAEAGLICAKRDGDYCCGVAAGGAGVTCAGLTGEGVAGGVVRSIRG